MKINALYNNLEIFITNIISAYNSPNFIHSYKSFFFSNADKKPII